VSVRAVVEIGPLEAQELAEPEACTRAGTERTASSGGAQVRDDRGRRTSVHRLFVEVPQRPERYWSVHPRRATGRRHEGSGERVGEDQPSAGDGSASGNPLGSPPGSIRNQTGSSYRWAARGAGSGSRSVPPSRQRSTL